MDMNKKGQVLVFFAISIVVLLGLAAIGIDVGYMYTVRHELQRSADAGALAGASYFKETGYWSSTPGDPQMALAETRARIFASNDNVLTSSLDNTEISVSFPENFKIKVGTERTVGLFFSRLFLGPTRNIRAYAIAEAYPVTEDVECIVPWGIPAPWPDDGDGEFNNGETFVWPSTPEDWIQYTQDHCNGAVTGWDQDNHVIDGTKNGRDNYLCQGSLQELKIGKASGDNVVQPGNFYGMDLSSIVASCPGMEPTSGADFYSYMIIHSCECEFSVDVDDDFDLDTKTGNMVGPTISPIAPDQYYGLPDPATDYYVPGVTLPGDWRNVESLMNGDPGAQWVVDGSIDGGHPESGNSDWAWGAGGTGDWQSSPRVIRIPIYSPDPNYNGGIHTPEKPGKTSFQPLGFVGFWIQDIQYFPPNNGTVVGRFITVGGWGGSGPDPGPAGTPILSIRLVE
jgi:hypothetical protein